ncbi:MAG: ABC transporter permease [Acidobacteriota bacterium]
MRFVAARAVHAVATLLLVVTLAFVVLEMLPGDPAGIAEDPSLGPAEQARLRAALGLDQPPARRYTTFLAHALQGDLGVSISRHRPVHDVLAAALGPTVQLAGSALVLSVLLGWLIGTRAASRPGGLAERAVRTVLPAVDAVPPFWLGLVAILLFAWRLGWLPAGHLASPTPPETWTALLVDRLRHLVLPVCVLAIPGTAPVARHQWSAMRRELRRPWVRAALANGVARGRVVWLRGTRAALLPLIALVGLGLPALVGGAVVVEVVFAWPGLGRVHQSALLARDIPLVLGGLVCVSGAVVAGRLLADLLSAWADPRLRRPGGGAR